MSDCCRLVGNLIVDPSCITSIQVQSSTEASKIEGVVLQGPTVGSINITAYASMEPHIGCPGRAGVTIDWVKKYDCDNDVIYLIFAGSGRSFIYGDIGGLASLVDSLDATCEILNASIMNGPMSMYEWGTQRDGYGLSYTGDPLPFNTDAEGDPPSFEIGTYDNIYLQSFNLQCSPGSLPVATYNFIYLPTGGIVG